MKMLRVATDMGGGADLAIRANARRTLEYAMSMDHGARADVHSTFDDRVGADGNIVGESGAGIDDGGKVDLGHWGGMGQVVQSCTVRPSTCEKSLSRVTSVAPRARAVAAIPRSFSSRTIPLRWHENFVLAYRSPADSGMGKQRNAGKVNAAADSIPHRR